MSTPITGSRHRAGWVVTALALGVLPLLGWALVRYRAHGAQAEAVATGRAGGPSPEGAEARAGLPAGAHMDEVEGLLRRARGNDLGPLIAAFAAWAGEPDALPARRILLGALVSQPQPMARLAALLAAVQASPLVPSEDPMQRDVVAAVSALWTNETMRKGRDLLFAESRPKAREVVISSFIELALSDRGAALDQAQRNGITSDFIDLYRQAPDARRRDIVAVVRRLGGDDTAELLRGNGLGANSPLGAHVRYRHDLEAARKAVAGGAH